MLAELQGRWKLVSIEGDGQVNDLSDMRVWWVIKGDKVRYGGEDFALLTTDAAAAPKVIDLRLSRSGRVYEGIYSVEEDTLKVCINKQTEGAKERPHVLSTAGKENWRLLVFRRDDVKEGGVTGEPPGYVGVALRLDEQTGEVVVDGLLEEGPARRSGLLKDNIVLEIGGGVVKDLASAVEAVRRGKPGAPLAFRIRHDGKEADIMIKVGVMPFTLLADLE